MAFETLDVGERLAFAGRVARGAGAEVLRHYGSSVHTTKQGGSPVTPADLASNEWIVRAIEREWPGEAILAEESGDSKARLGADLVWLVDPLDGTKEFLAHNGEFSVMIGVAAGGRPVLGVVFVPVRARMYRASAGAGAWAEDAAGSVRRMACARTATADIRMVASRSHSDETIDAAQGALGVTDVELSGSVGIKCALIADGARDLYLHPGPHLKEWDTCAAEVLVREAGGQVTDWTGDGLRYNKPDPSHPAGIVACAAGIHARVITAVRPLHDAAVAGNGAADG